MLISYNWLRELTDTKLTPLELRERLTMVGLAIDAVEEIEGDSVIDVEVPSNRPDCLSFGRDGHADPTAGGAARGGIHMANRHPPHRFVTENG